MEGKRLAQVGAAIFVGLAIAMTLVQLRGQPDAPAEVPITADVAGADPLAIRLRACNAMGEEALSSTDCRAAWAEQRRRFFSGTPSKALPERKAGPASGLPVPDPAAHGSK